MKQCAILHHEAIERGKPAADVIGNAIAAG